MTSATPAASMQETQKKSAFPLGVKLPAIGILLLILALTFSTYLSAQTTEAALVHTLQRELSAQAETKAEVLRDTLEASRSAAVDLAAAAAVTKYDENGIGQAIQSVLTYNERLLGAAIAYEPSQFRQGIYYWAPSYTRAPDGTFEFTQLGNPLYNYFAWEWYTLPKALEKPVLSTPHQVNGSWAVTWSAPFYNASSGEFRGVATADALFSQIEEQVKSISVGENGYAMLLDPQGVILGVGEKGGYYQTMENSMLKLSRASQAKGWEQVVTAMLANKPGFTAATDLQNRPMYVAYAPIGLGTGWSLALAYPQEELQAQVDQARNTLVQYALLVIAVFGAVMYIFTLGLTQPIKRLTRHAREAAARELQVAHGKLIEPINIHTNDEIEELAEAFNRMAGNVSQAVETLEEKVALRTADIERNALEFATIAEVARDITIIRDLKTLLNVSVNLIRERFAYYHVGIFLVDERGEYAVLRAASSHAAEQMLAQNYKLKVGQEGMVGSVTRSGRAYISLDVGADAVHFENPYLPDTHSEITLPLRSHSVTIGALDIQTTKQSAFDERDLKILQLLADQIAAAIENAQLTEQVEKAVKQSGAFYRTQMRQGWQADLKKRERAAFEYDGLQVSPIPANLPETLLKRIQAGKAVILKEKTASQSEKKTLLVPLRLQEQTIGVIGLEQEDPSHVWTEEELGLVEAAANRAALTLENTRLLEESQRRAIKERAIFEATEKIGSALDVENILQATAEEIERILNSAEVTLQFSADKKS
ncbi:MAG: hypothetical protein Fur002_08930 [Anaerolineales bacterium]